MKEEEQAQVGHPHKRGLGRVRSWAVAVENGPVVCVATPSTAAPVAADAAAWPSSRQHRKVQGPSAAAPVAADAAAWPLSRQCRKVQGNFGMLMLGVVAPACVMPAASLQARLAVMWVEGPDAVC